METSTTKAMSETVEEQQQAYALMKKIFADSDIIYEENVPDNQTGVYVVKDGVAKRLSEDFLKGFNTEIIDKF